jgi:hypothetical protein
VSLFSQRSQVTSRHVTSRQVQCSPHFLTHTHSLTHSITLSLSVIMNITEVGFTDLISQLVATTSLDVVPVVGSSSFVTVDSVRQRASEYVALCGGRVTSAELQSYLNIEKLHVDNIIQKVRMGVYVCVYVCECDCECGCMHG